MKKLFFFAAGAAMMAACSQTDEIAESALTAQQAQETPVTFGVYTGKATTRAGKAGVASNDGSGSYEYKFLDGTKPGFGAFAYYTDDQKFNQFATPNFMYNQQVKFKETNIWTYSPVKYWPNEFGDDAESANVDYLSFFAYAPYVAVNADTGLPTQLTDAEVTTILEAEAEAKSLNDSSTPKKSEYVADAANKARVKADYVSKNIVQLSKNSLTGDPFVRYVVDFNPATSVDLLWGVAKAVEPKNDTNTEGTHTDISKKSTSDDVLAGMPFINMVKPTVDSKISFQFQHALVRLNATIDADVDVETKTDGSNNHTNEVGSSHNTTKGITDNDSKTRIYVRSVTFEGLATEGILDLNNTEAMKPLWKDINGAVLANKSITVYDGRVDGSEGTSNGANPSETPSGLNPVIVQNSGNVAYSETLADAGVFKQEGVTNTPVNLFNGAYNAEKGAQPIFAIPGKATPKITIVYDVETADENLAGYLSDGKTHGSVVENKITKVIGSLTEFEAGKQYTIKIHLGVTSVKFDVDVAAWGNGDVQNVDLPINK